MTRRAQHQDSDSSNQDANSRDGHSKDHKADESCPRSSGTHNICEVRRILRVSSIPAPAVVDEVEAPAPLDVDRDLGDTVAQKLRTMFDDFLLEAAPLEEAPLDAAQFQTQSDDASEQESDDLTSVDSLEVFRPPGTDHVEMSGTLLSLLREQLRQAEALEEEEGSGIRQRPTPPEGLPIAEEPEVDPLAELHVELDAPCTLDEWAESVTTLPELEVALAPNSENNFYGGFDQDHPDGLFVATYRGLEIGTPVYAIVLLPGGLRFRTPAIVEFTRGHDVADYDAAPGMGLRMCGLDDRMRRLIREFVDHRPPMFYVG